MMNVYNSITKGLDEAINHERGNIKLKTNKISIEPTPEYSKEKIKNLRQILGFTQVVFANVMGVSLKTVEAWEAGKNHPDGSSSRMLQLLEKEPHLLERIGIMSIV